MDSFRCLVLILSPPQVRGMVALLADPPLWASTSAHAERQNQTFAKSSSLVNFHPRWIRGNYSLQLAIGSVTGTSTPAGAGWINQDHNEKIDQVLKPRLLGE